MVNERGARGAQSRARILEATIALAAERGYDGTTMNEVSQRSGLPVSSVYWHFDNKDDLLAAALEHGFEQWRARVPSAATPDPAALTDFEDAVRMRFANGLQVLAARPDFWRLGMLLLLQARDPEPTARRRFVEVHEAVAASVTSWWDTHLPPHISDPAVARAVGVSYVSMLNALYVAQAAEHAWDTAALASSFADGIVAMVRSRMDPEAPASGEATE